MGKEIKDIHILLAEDDSNLGFVVSDNLKANGYKVTLCQNGEIALKTFANENFDLCILDIMMPKKDGFAVLAEMKKNPAWAKIPCIVASNLGQKEDIDKAKTLGATDYIIKTDLSMGKLMEQIRRAAGG